jgi:hypothetical protein
MTDLFNRLDFWISLIGVGLVLYLWVRRWWRRFTMSTPPPVRYEYRPAAPPETVAPKPLPQNQFLTPENWHASQSEPRIDLAAIEEADRETVIDILSVLKKDGEYLLSANKIRDLVGGADAVVKSRVASHRPKPPAPKVEAHLDRPANGWGRG